jgi:glycosyltransferase involved in cell wall biosynthesis
MNGGIPTMKIKLSIAIPTYNGAETIRETLDSIVSQLEDGVEIVVSDNASTDDTAEIVREYQASYPVIRYFCNDENLGADRNFDLAVRRAQGEYAWLFAFVAAFVIRIRLGRLHGIHQFWGSNPDFLRSLISSSKIVPRPMFYLDAHWGKYCPLENEFEIIGNLSSALVIVDDFQVPGKPDFGFDTYGSVPLSLERIAPILRKSSARIFFPAHEAASESGYCRGTLVVAMGADIPANLAEWGFPFTFTLIEEYYLDEHRI